MKFYKPKEAKHYQHPDKESDQEPKNSLNVLQKTPVVIIIIHTLTDNIFFYKGKSLLSPVPRYVFQCCF